MDKILLVPCMGRLKDREGYDSVYFCCRGVYPHPDARGGDLHPIDIRRQGYFTSLYGIGTRFIVGENPCGSLKVTTDPISFLKTAMEWRGKEKVLLFPKLSQLNAAIKDGFFERCAENDVGVILANGFRLLFPENTIIRGRDCSIDNSEWPHNDVLLSIRTSGAKVYSGAGFAEGMRLGSWRLAEDAGFAGLFSFEREWNDYANRPNV